ncbi:MAG: 5'-nucleotidase C-terminal domain-containing protein [Deltaproteobacteria bacterium]|jgi:2',3'-cyclic-nucleotide 2'-phosphodiesterase (5'-nucleotidase family)|nr:5'-nucleotidase C-terminal domain-containing protein [Deltaproteobacteria bacterium]
MTLSTVLIRLTRLLAILCLFLVPAGQATADLKIFVTNDVHGHAAEEPAEGRIGYARLKAALDAAKAEGHEVYLFDAGDAFSGSAAAQVDHGRSIAELMGLLNYRVLTPGNHAFDHNEAERNPLYYSETLIKTVRENASGPVDVVAANLTRHGETVPGLGRDPVVVHDETADKPDGLRLIVAGVVTPYVRRPSLQASLPGYDFGLLENPAATKAKILADLTASLEEFNRPQDVTIVLSHLGYPGSDGDRDGRLVGPDLAAVPNVDFVADGHTHEAVPPQKIGEAVYANGGRHLEHFLEITIGDDGAGTMVLKDFQDVADLTPDPTVVAYLSELDRRQGLTEVLFETPDAELFSDRDLRTDNIALGRLICLAMMKASGADLALHNVGGIRAGLPGGSVSLRDLFDVLPFGDELVSAEMTGEEIEAFLNRGSGHGGRGAPQFYGFLAFAWRGEDGRPEVAGLRLSDGERLDSNKTYTVALNGFMARNMKLPTKNFGDLVLALRQVLTADFANFEELRDNRSLLVFESFEEARAAWTEAGP